MSNKKSILVIDDEMPVRYSFELALENSGYHVVTVDGGEKGVEEFKRNVYDLVFLDLKMPSLNGVMTLKKIRECSMTTSIYVVTAFHKEFLEALDEVRKADLPFQLLRKPIGNTEILALAHSALE